jgi:phosphomannomutase
VLVVGEESGGFGHRNYVPERDGILNSLIFLEMIAKRGKKLSQILDDLERRFGKSYYERADFKISRASVVERRSLKEKITKIIIKKMPKKIGGMEVREVRAYDGVKFVLGSPRLKRVGGEAWLLLRPSGTEPLVRVYAEADSRAKVRELLKEGKRLIADVLN